MTETTSIDERSGITHEDAVATARVLARQGLFVGLSSGAHVLAACRLAQRHGLESVVTTLNDGGER